MSLPFGMSRLKCLSYFETLTPITFLSFYVKVPRVDITAPANVIEYHPALLAHADDNAGGGSSTVAEAPESKPAALPVEDPKLSDSDDSYLSGEDLSDMSLDSDDSDLDAVASLSPADQAENEDFGSEYTGPSLSDETASRLLVLMLHASTCPCR